jgi:hypothetical protein
LKGSRTATDREMELVKQKNFVVYITALLSPYFFGDDNSRARWKHSDIGKLYATTALTLPLDLRIGSADAFVRRDFEMRKVTIQEHFKQQFFSTLRSVEYYRRMRDEAIAQIGSPYVHAEGNLDAARNYLAGMEARYPNISIDVLIDSVLTMKMAQTDQRPEDIATKDDPLLNAVGLAVERGALEFIRLRRLNEVGKTAPWKFHLEYDLVTYFLLERLGTEGQIQGTDGVRRLVLEDLKKEKYTRNGHE